MLLHFTITMRGAAKAFPAPRSIKPSPIPLTERKRKVHTRTLAVCTVYEPRMCATRKAHATREGINNFARDFLRATYSRPMSRASRALSRKDFHKRNQNEALSKRDHTRQKKEKKKEGIKSMEKNCILLFCAKMRAESSLREV